MHPLSPSLAIPQTDEPRPSEYVPLPAKESRPLSTASVWRIRAFTIGGNQRYAGLPAPCPGPRKGLSNRQWSCQSERLGEGLMRGASQEGPWRGSLGSHRRASMDGMAGWSGCRSLGGPLNDLDGVIQRPRTSWAHFGPSVAVFLRPLPLPRWGRELPLSSLSW